MTALAFSVDSTLQFDVEQFLYREGLLLDDRRFDEWISLFTADGEYWMPMAWDQPNPHDHISLLYESAEVLTMRMQRLKELAALSQRPFSRTCHQVSNVIIESEEANSLSVRSTLVMVEYRRDEQRTFAGRVRHVLIRSRSSFQIRSKRVDLLNCDSEGGHLRISIPF